MHTPPAAGRLSETEPYCSINPFNDTGNLDIIPHLQLLTYGDITAQIDEIRIIAIGNHHDPVKDVPPVGALNTVERQD